ncbi:MAG: polyphosphate kinase 1 [Candidatus Latescibacterota bacterium]
MKKYTNREISWLSFNGRVLQEAADPRTPLIERIKFLGIFSSNLDEFFRVRVATLKRLTRANTPAKAIIGDKPQKTLHEIQDIVLRQSNEFDAIYREILKRLAEENIFLVNEEQLDRNQQLYVKAYFHQEVRPALIPIMLENIKQFPALKDHAIYLAVRLLKEGKSRSPRYALIEAPTDVLSRFLVLPARDGTVQIILLDDVIRVGLRDIFSMFSFTGYEAYTIKLTRDAELDLDDDIALSFLEKVSKSLKQRKKGLPVRFIYDSSIPPDFLDMLTRRLQIKSQDSLIPGGRYHNFKDFMNFPHVGGPELAYAPLPPLPHREITSDRSFFSIIREKDILIHFPYQSFHYVIDFLREAAIDPKVVSIRMTLYRIARNSKVINALINAARNGKSVAVVMELQARFDEEANIYWSNRLKEEGVRVIHGAPSYKVHAKLCLVERKEKGGVRLYADFGTGNFHEGTALVYSDISLFTADRRITGEAAEVFEILENYYKSENFKHLLVSPFTTRTRLTRFINDEIHHAQKGKEAWIILKTNSLIDTKIIDKLYEASAAGVKISLLVRGMCSLIPGMKGLSENITATSIVDRFLEHSRVYAFCNGGEERCFIGSADLMPRNIDRRIEVLCPIYDRDIRKEIRDYLDIQLRDNVKARLFTSEKDNRYQSIPDSPPIQSQIEWYTLLQKKHLGTVSP